MESPVIRQMLNGSGGRRPYSTYPQRTPHMITAETQKVVKAAEVAKVIIARLHQQFPRLGSISFDIGYDPDTGRPIWDGMSLAKFHTLEDGEPGAEDFELGLMEKLEISAELEKPAAEDVRTLALEAGITSPSTSGILGVIAWRAITESKAGFRTIVNPEDYCYYSKVWIAITQGFDDGPAEVSALPEGSPVLWVGHTRTETVSHVL